jgi:membrane protein implicated in regulation of membrane protease activity
MVLLLDLTFWSWLVIGLALLALELLAPFTFFLWLGASALVTALVLLVAPETSWQMQFLVFSVLSVASIIISRRYLVKHQTESEVPNLNRRAQQYVGKIFTLSEGIEQGVGKIRVDDTYWKVTGPTLDKGAEVRVVAAEGAVFTVEPTVGK